MKAVYGIDVGEARDLVERRFKPLRPYGSVGRLGGLQDPSCVSFGAKVDYVDLRARAEGIKTYTEQSHDAETIERMQEAVAEAETIVFLGFAFHEPNMKLLAPTKPSQARRVFATADGLSEPEAEHRRQEIARMLFCGKPPASAKRSVRSEYAPILSPENIVVRRDLKCFKFFDDYGALLRAGSLVALANHVTARQRAGTAKS